MLEKKNIYRILRKSPLITVINVFWQFGAEKDGKPFDITLIYIKNILYVFLQFSYNYVS
jgi:hypothetical protein